ncbi:MAG: Serine/threonine protein kinase PrkC, regulator of stationary phase [Myxococcales bacterium]|nr:Serine/threonine protein kinase PrkC, regulator of stationary phase [Myxococcales bacterium]
MSSDKKTGEPTIQVAVTGEETATDRPPPSADVLVAGRYRLGRRIGKGGMGEVMAARDEQIGRDVAIKRMRAANPSERAILRFLREASVQGRLEHPAIVPVHEIGRDTDGLPFFVMKKLTGTSLSEILVGEDQQSFPLQRVLRAFADVCLAVEFAHVRGIIHRDLKADNIMLGDFGEAYVLDWGVAKVLGEDEGDFADVGSGSGERATAVGTAIGTPGYMAPEQVRGIDIDGRADVYTLGCLLFEILAGEPLHPRGFEGLQSALIGREARPSLRAPDRVIPPELDALCVDATAVDREKRIPTARVLGARVQQFLDGDRDLAMRRVLAREHLQRAQSAFNAADSAERRRIAMRESAAALALDPKLDGAAELVGRLMLEPPREEPRDVTEAISADDVHAARAIARAGLWAVVGGILFMPLLWWIAPAGSFYVPVLTGLLLLDALVAIHAVRAATPRPAVVMFANAVIVVVVARMFSPIMIAPGVAASLAMAMVLTPRFSRLGSSVTVAVFMIGAVLTPLFLERAGALTPTMSVDANGVLFRAPAVAGYEGPTFIVCVIYAIALIAGACVAGEAMRRRTRSAHRHLHLQAWQLRQLVPR